MSLQTLENSQASAAQLLDVNPSEIKQIQEPHLYDLGTIEIDGLSIPAYRAHSGQEGPGKGGLRMAPYETTDIAVGTVQELSVEMLIKLALRDYGRQWHGAKGLIVADGRTLSLPQRQRIMTAYEGLMEDADLAGYKSDVPAGDLFTNGLSDYYADARHKNNPGDAYWQASITGKSPEKGGLTARTSATGLGTYRSQRTLMEQTGLISEMPVTTTIQGFGNVAAWHAHFASEDPNMRIGAISEFNGMIYTDAPEGLKITEAMVAEIGDNPKFSGNKLATLAQRIEQEQGIRVQYHQNPNAILEYPTEIFVPAAMGNVINEDNVGKLLAERNGMKLKAIIEAANGPTSPKAHEILTQRGVIVVPDVVANGAGVDCSIREYQANVHAVELGEDAPSMAAVQKALIESSDNLVREVLATSKELQVNDLRVAAAAVAIRSMMGLEKPHMVLAV